VSGIFRVARSDSTATGKAIMRLVAFDETSGGACSENIHSTTPAPCPAQVLPLSIEGAEMWNSFIQKETSLQLPTTRVNASEQTAGLVRQGADFYSAAMIRFSTRIPVG
jgi:hypothetical protein